MGNRAAVSFVVNLMDENVEALRVLAEVAAATRQPPVSGRALPSLRAANTTLI